MDKVCPEHIVELMWSSGLISRNQYYQKGKDLRLQEICADGSQRRFFRIIRNETAICVGVSPCETEGQHLAEAHAAVSIGRHLYAKNVAVPEILAANEQTGLILFEDCGDTRLYDVVVDGRTRDGRISGHAEDLYHKVIRELVHMQIKGADQFKKSWCYDTPEYDHAVMVQRESGYFLRAFWFDLLDGDKVSQVNQEFDEIAVNAGQGLPLFFLHRDFQCRNIMIVDAEPRFIDFQGGRLGPPGYDLASLLIDPYSSLSEQSRHDYLQLYLAELRNHLEYDTDVFLKQYSYLELQRNLQIIGAFAFLYKARGKIFFKKYIPPALENLHSILQRNEFSSYSILRSLVNQALSRIKKHL